jgi:hypothetical protein
LVNHVGGGAIFAGINARFVALAFILRKMRSSMVNAALLFARRTNFYRHPFPATDQAGGQAFCAFPFATQR